MKKIVLCLFVILVFCVSNFSQNKEDQSTVILNPDEIRKILPPATLEGSGENAEETIKLYILKIMESQNTSEQGSIVQDLYGECLKRGLNPSPDIAELFLTMAIQAKDKNDMEGFQRYLNYGLTFDQKNPAIQQALATVSLENKGVFSPEYFFQSFAGWLYSFTNYETRYVALANLALWFRTFGYLLVGILSIILFIRYNSLLRHDVEENLQVEDEKLKKVAGWAFLFLPSIILLSGFWWCVFWCALFMVYSRVAEKVMITISLAILVISGVVSVSMQHELFLAFYPPHYSNVRCYSNRIDIGPDMILANHLDPSDPLSDTYTFVLANRYLLYGGYLKAENLYKAILERNSNDPYVLNNLGCLYYYENRVAEAIAEWSRAIEIKSNMAVAYLNRSLGKNQQFDFDGAKEDQEKSRSLDPVLYQRFSESLSGENIPIPYYPSLETTRNVAYEQFTHFNKSLQGPLKPTKSKTGAFFRPAFTIGTIVLFLISLFFVITKKREKFARVCLKCGRPFCNQCKTSLEFESFCGQCVHLYIKQDGVSPQARMQKNYEVESYFKRGKIVRAVLSILAPGSGHIWEGHFTTGFTVLILWCGFLSGFMSRSYEYPMPFNLAGGTSQSAYNLIAGIFIVVLWFLFGLTKALSRQPANLLAYRR